MICVFEPVCGRGARLSDCGFFMDWLGAIVEASRQASR
jgi:hypothetical protein